MPFVRIHQGNKEVGVDALGGQNLLQVIRDNGFELYAPCGGNGTCGKCRVQVKGEDFVTSCVYYPDHNIEVVLPDKRASQILSTQYEYSLKVPVYPGELAMKVSYPLGVAIDIGTSTVVFYFVNLITGSLVQTKGIVNPQAKFGADVISRIQHCSNEKGLNELNKEIVRAINKVLKSFAETTGVATDQIVKITVAGNATMLHILLGIDPTSIALAPFTPTFTEAKKLSAKESGFDANIEAELYLLPSISGYVGADIVAGLASLSPPVSKKTYLYLDIGTNGEIALVTPDQILCCATAAGPAFEGANISCGMGAFSGAIATFSKEGSYSTISNEPALGICGSGLIDIVAYMVTNNFVSADGELEKDFEVGKNELTNQSIGINQQDIREVQLAKAAILAGISILVKSANLDFENLDALFLAGGFGNYINVESAVIIGLLPKKLKDKVIPIGNASGTGATLALKSIMFEENINSILEKAEYIELSSHEDFVLEYAMSMGFNI